MGWIHDISMLGAPHRGTYSLVFLHPPRRRRKIERKGWRRITIVSDGKGIGGKPIMLLAPLQPVDIIVQNNNALEFQAQARHLTRSHRKSYTLIALTKKKKRKQGSQRKPRNRSEYSSPFIRFPPFKCKDWDIFIVNSLVPNSRHDGRVV